MILPILLIEATPYRVREHRRKFRGTIFIVGAGYGVATISRLLKIIGLFCKRAYKRDDILQKRPII